MTVEVQLTGGGTETGGGTRLPVLSRIRSKLIFLHTLFSLALAAVLLVTLRVPVSELVADAELREAIIALELDQGDADKDRVGSAIDGLTLESGSAERLGIREHDAALAQQQSGAVVTGQDSQGRQVAIRYDPVAKSYRTAWVHSSAARAVVGRLYLVLTLALLAVYALIAVALEALVLPRQVYEPVRRIKDADEAVQRGDRTHELISEAQIPKDELGQIMQWRNQSIVKLREQEQELAAALARLESTAAELKRKNHMLEMARRNLADQDRLISIGMMSAGLAHELNTPLSVLKGCVEQLEEDRGSALPRERVELMGRVIRRLESLSESLLDFSRARPTRRENVELRRVLSEAWTLVRIDRGVPEDLFVNGIPDNAQANGDEDRLTQVFVNLLRNAVDALEGGGDGHRIEASYRGLTRDGESWVSVTLTDTGPGISPDMLDRLFEPFASTRLDAKGTGLGLAVSDGIVREQGGTIIARNVNGAVGSGAEFEVLLRASENEGPVQQLADE